MRAHRQSIFVGTPQILVYDLAIGQNGYLIHLPEMEVRTLAVPINIMTLLAGNAVEWARIEFKETWDAEASLKTI